MSFPRFGPNGAFAFFSDERDVPPGWQPTAEAAKAMQTLAPPAETMGAPVPVAMTYVPDFPPQRFVRERKGRRR